MADDIRTAEIENRANASQGHRLRAEDSVGVGLGNANSDLREKGDANDIAEVVTQVDAEAAVSEIGLRFDSPADLTREAVQIGPQPSSEAANIDLAADPIQQSGIGQTVESRPIVDGSSVVAHNDGAEQTSAPANDAAVQTNELPAEPVARAMTADGNTGPIAPEIANPAAQNGEPAGVQGAAKPVAVNSGWTAQLDTGTDPSDDGRIMTLSDDAAATITLEDGSQIAFDGLEKIEY